MGGVLDEFKKAWRETSAIEVKLLNQLAEAVRPDSQELDLLLSHLSPKCARLLTKMLFDKVFSSGGCKLAETCNDAFFTGPDGNVFRPLGMAAGNNNMQAARWTCLAFNAESSRELIHIARALHEKLIHAIEHEQNGLTCRRLPAGILKEGGSVVKTFLGIEVDDRPASQSRLIPQGDFEFSGFARAWAAKQDGSRLFEQLGKRAIRRGNLDFILWQQG